MTQIHYRSIRVALAAAALICAGGCATTPPSTKAETTARINAALGGEHRSAGDRARDSWRHPRETLLFFGLRPEMKVVEIWPGGGWYTAVIAPVVQGKGQYVAAHFPPNPDNKFVTDALAGYDKMLSARPDLYGGAKVVGFGPGHTEIAPNDSVDMIVTFRNIHNWMARDFAPDAFAAMFRALKPGGVLGVVEHRGNASVAQDPKAKNGYVNEDYAIKLIESAGFRLIAKSEINANPKDTKDYAEGVWTLPPTYRLGDKDRAKYAAIGESDRFTLRFVKPAAR